MAGKSKKKHDKKVTPEEEVVLEGVFDAIKQLKKFLSDEESELPALHDISCDAHTKLLNGIHDILGDDDLYQLKELIDMADDPDFRCPK